MEIDVREEKGGKPDVIRFSENSALTGCDPDYCYLSDEEGDCATIYKEEIPNLIKALKKYQELYG